MNPIGALLDYLPYLIGLVVALFLYRKLQSVAIPGLDFQGLLGRFRAPDHLAQQERRRGNLLVAGQMYEELEMFDQAVETYLEGEEYWAAAQVLESQRKLDRAAQLYHQAGDKKKAAEVFEQSGKWSKAAALHLEDGNKLDAARLLGDAGDWEQAAALFQKSGYPLKAGKAFEELGDGLRAAECYEAHFMETVTYSTTYSGGAPAKELAVARRAGELYRDAGQLERARDILVRGGFFAEAAAVCQNLGHHAQAGEYYTRAERLEDAAAAYEQAGDPPRAAHLRGEIAFKENRIADAAALYRQGQDYLRAAELFESVDMLPEAAASFEDAESHAAAAGVYIRAGLKDRAAAAFERGGAWEDAARLYEEIGNGAKATELFERAGLTFKSGVSAAEAGDVQGAIGLLQRVSPDDENYRAATERLAELFLKVGRPGLAIERLEKVLAGEPVARGTLELYYWLARAQEARPSPGEAVAIYKKVLAEDVSFRDVNDRVSSLGAATAAARHGGELPPTAVPPRPAGPPREARPGDTLGKFEILDVLGQGAMGRVYLARDTVLEREVALKLMATPEDPALRQRFEREARAVARMTHPNVVTVYDLGRSADGHIYIAMELLRGSDLLQAVRSSPAISQLDREVAIVLQVLAGLEHAHSAGVVHRDIKPANVFIGLDGSVKIMDFGVARLSSGTSGATGAGGVVGTADYMSPEQVKGGRVEGPSDLFSVGVMFYELLTGRRPFRADSLMATFYAITHHEPDYAPITSSPELAPLAPTLKLALSKDVASRYRSAGDFAEDLKRFLRQRSTLTGRSLEQLLDLSGTLPGGTAGQRARGTQPPRAAGPAPPPPGPPQGAASAPRRGAAAAGGTAPPARRPIDPAAPRGPAPPIRRAPGPGRTRPPGVAGASPPGAPPVRGEATGPRGSRATRFKADKEIGRGPLGVVYSAVDTTNGKRLAMRVLTPADDATRHAHERLLDDLRAAGKIAHPNIARVLGMDHPGGRTAVLTELVEGRGLDALLAAGSRPGLRQLLAIGRALAGALAFAHSRGIAHGTVQPSNVMLAERSVKLTDLGLGRLRNALQPRSRYASPERRLQPADDVFGLGGVLFFLLTGAEPPAGAEALASRRGVRLPEPLDRLVADCLAPDPASRVAGADEVLKRLDAVALT